MAKSTLKPLTWRAQGVADAIDGTSAFDGAMAALTNLVFDPQQAARLVPRAAAVQLSNFSGFTTPGVPTALLIVGNYAWGFVPSGRFAGKDEPFCYDIINGVFITLTNVTAANCPATQGATGDWTPPTMALITNGRLALTHPGYDGINTFVGWIDISQASLTGITGTVHNGTTTIDTLSANPLTVGGWQVGMKITGTNIPANTYITAITATSVTISQAATGGGAGVALTVTGGSQAAPLYGAGNLNGNPLTGVATCVAFYSARAWYAWKNYAIYSDTNNPTQVTNASQALQIGDGVPINAMAGLPLTSQVNGGTLQSLIVFKGAGAFTQITGDAALSTLAQNVVNGSVGTYAPNSICATPQGLAYVAPDGLRIVGLDGVVRDPIGIDGQGVAVPFQQALYPSRICAAFNQNVIRITTQNRTLPGNPAQEWWYHTTAKRWSGPHTSTCALIKPYFGTSVGPFVQALFGVSGQLFTSYAYPPASVTYTENGQALTWVWKSLLTPDNGQVAMNELEAQSTVSCALPFGQAVTAFVFDETGAQLDTVSLQSSAGAAALWGSFAWGAAGWGTSVEPYRQKALNWNKPIVFKQAAIEITGASMNGFVLGDLHANVELLDYAL